MLSRVAENMYWMSRYLERAEDTARLINAITLMALDMPEGIDFGWDKLIGIAGLEEEFFSCHEEATEESVMHFLIGDTRNPSSILNCITFARENTRTFREMLPTECWELVNELYLFARQNLLTELTRKRRYEHLQRVIRMRQSLIGLLQGTMSRDLAFKFLTLGRNLERADMSSRILDVSCAAIMPHSNSSQDLAWMNILKALSAYQMYRRYISVHADGGQVVEFLLKNADFPRSIRFCLQEMRDLLTQLPHPEQTMPLINRTLTMLNQVSSAALVKQGLHEFIDELQLAFNQINQSLYQQYFRLASMAPAAAPEPVE